jgi:hypothetical protein
MYKYTTSKKVRFLEDILKFLEQNPFEHKEDDLATKVCFNYVNQKPLPSIRMTKRFIPEGKERLFFRIASIYLEKEGLLDILKVNPNNPTYIITYQGIILVRKGGLGKKIFLDNTNGFLQRLFWFVGFLTLLFTILLQLGYLDFLKNS